MRRLCSGIAGVVLALGLAGCGETVPEGPGEFKASNSEAINKFRDNMSANAKNKVYLKKPVETSPADSKTADKKK